MKLITFVVPCYNSQNYMQKCVDSLLVAGDEAEIIIVDDGSTDKTGEIADGYARKFPDIVNVVHKPNGGHGSGLNAGVERASGLYFKVVDSDDWLEKSSLEKFIATLKAHVAAGKIYDLYITNFIYYHASDDTKFISKYVKKMPAGEIEWKKVKKFRFSHTLMIHALTYNTAFLKKHFRPLPEHTFYVDNIYAFSPLVSVNRAYYLDVDMYYYYIGRQDQSVNVVNCIARYSQQLVVMTEMCLSHTSKEINSRPKGLKNYLWHYLYAVMMNTLFFACGEVTKERKEGVKKMWRDIKSHDKKMYRKLRYTGYPLSVAFMPWRMRSKVMMLSYNIIKKRVKLGL